MSGVNITIANGNLSGAANTDDGILGAVITGVTEGGGYTLGTPILVTSMIDVATAGITAANNPYAIRHLQEFYNEAPLGAQLYVMLTANTITVSAMADKTNASGAIKLLNFAQGKIKVIGLLADDKAIHTAGGTITITNGCNADVYTAATNLLALINTFVAAENPLRGIVGVTSYAGTASALTTINSGTTNNRVGLVIGDTQSYDATYTSAAVGLALGKLAAIPVQSKMSKVKLGPLSNTTAFLGTVALTLTNGDMAVIAGKGFITFKMWAKKTGFYWSGDTMATVPTDDYFIMARGRVIDKAHELVYSFLVDEVDDEVPTLPDGTIDPGYAKDLEGKISGTTGLIDTNMVSLKNCIGSATFIDPTQNIVNTSIVNVAVTIYGVGYSSTFNILLGL
jgi:hypothetical protein